MKTPAEVFAHEAVSFDLETHLIQPGLLAPPIVCGSFASAGSPGGEVFSKKQTLAEIECFLKSDRILVGANIAFDFGCVAAERPDLIPLIFDKYDRGQVWDIQIAEALHALAGGHLGKNPDGSPMMDARGKRTERYSLDTCVRLVLGRNDAKSNDFWRLRYAMLEGIPIEKWPLEARLYPADDARNTREVALAQFSRNRNLVDLSAQCRAAFALHLGSAWGFRTDGLAVQKLLDHALDKKAAGAQHFTELGFLGDEGKKDGHEVKRRMARAYGAKSPCPICGGTGRVKSPVSGNDVYCTQKSRPNCTLHEDCREHPAIGQACLRAVPCDGTGLDLTEAPLLPKTPTGGIAAGRDELAESGDEDLINFSGYQEEDKIPNVYVPFLQKGVYQPLNPRPNVLLASGRISYEEVIQLIPRKGGVRECFVPREGYLYSSADYESGELCTLAQVTLWTVGWSRMAETINATRDPSMLHTALGAKMLGVSLDEMKKRLAAKDPQAKDFRQAAKPANFGFPGGMGAVKLVLASRKAAAGETVGPDQRKYRGIRFCILVGGRPRCGEEIITNYRGQDTDAPVCRACCDAADNIRSAWFDTWQEMDRYFKFISNQIQSIGELTQFVSQRVRGGVGFCDGANTLFQGLLADGAKRAFWKIARECYAVPASPLYGSRPLALFHDESFLELREVKAHVAGPRQADLMIEGLKEVTPDIYVACKPALMRRWSKKAEPAYIDGRLVPYEDVQEKTA